jgi:flavin-dependent dehydrogenase
MKLQIFGAGIAGSFLYHLLQQHGFRTTIFDIRKFPECRCAWGVNYKDAKKLYRKIGVNIDDYVLSTPEHVIINSKFWINAKKFIIFDRKRLLLDLWKEMNFKKTRADIIVDATGFARAILPKLKKDSLYPTVQQKVRFKSEENIYILLGKTGYAWAFPLGNNQWHVGAGARSCEEIEYLFKEFKEMYNFDFKRNKGACACKAFVRMLPPEECKPIVWKNIYGIGEAVGCVSSLGEGNAPALQSAYIFFSCLVNDELNEYEKRLLEEMKWITLQQRFLERFRNEKYLSALFLLLFSMLRRPRSARYFLIDLLRFFIARHLP